MPAFSDKSKRRLQTCDTRLRLIFEEVVQEFDCTILEGHRGRERQNQMVAEGKSKVRWPKGMHNTVPSRAVDVAPYPIDWKDRDRFMYFAGYVKGIAQKHGVTLRWGGDWNGDWHVADNSFDDLVHFEIT